MKNFGDPWAFIALAVIPILIGFAFKWFGW
jgi:hypothetical protein